MSTLREEIDALLNEGIRVATEFLENDKEFFPFALRLTQDGDIDLVQADLGDEQSDFADLIAATESSSAKWPIAAKSSPRSLFPTSS